MGFGQTGDLILYEKNCGNMKTTLIEMDINWTGDLKGENNGNWMNRKFDMKKDRIKWEAM